MATKPSSSPSSILTRFGKVLLWTLLGLFLLLGGLYLFGVIYFDGPLGNPKSTGNLLLGLAWAATTLGLLFVLKTKAKRVLVITLSAAIVLIPWIPIQPSNQRDWKPEFLETGWVDVEGDLLTFHNFRNFDYDAEGNATENWETRRFHLSNLSGLDYFHDAFGGDLLAHPIISFDFGEEGHVCLSIETRREKTESFSALGGLFKMFELQYIFGSESDFIRVRTNVRNEPVYLYRMRATPEQAREILFESIVVQNEMRDRPRWYNVITSNCTTSLRAQTPAESRDKFDIRMLINGKLDEYVHERGAIADDGLSFEELRPRCLINDAARAQVQAEGYSERVRLGRPGFSSSTASQ
ncbi:MAG: DUF4105 domain-containing protein [Verrucomicrobiales bacterium]